MKQNNYKPQIPDVMEAIFDAAYLIFGEYPKLCVNLQTDVR